MKGFRFRPFSGFDPKAIGDYLKVDLAKGLSELVEGLRHLRFEENFDEFTYEVEITSGATAKIPNRLNTVDLKWWPVRITGDNRLVEGSAMTREFIYIKNASSTTTRATLIFVR